MAASSPLLAQREPQLANDPIGAQDRLQVAMEGIDHDLVIIDCPPSLGLLTVNGLFAADQALVVTEPGAWASDGVAADPAHGATASAPAAPKGWAWPASSSTAWAAPATPATGTSSWWRPTATRCSRRCTSGPPSPRPPPSRCRSTGSAPGPARPRRRPSSTSSLASILGVPVESADADEPSPEPVIELARRAGAGADERVPGSRTGPVTNPLAAPALVTTPGVSADPPLNGSR